MEFKEDVYSVFDYNNSVEQYQAYGGTGLASIQQQIEKLEAWLQTLTD